MVSGNKSKSTLKDPRTLYPQPPYKDQEPIDMPGREDQMDPRPAHGEDSYQGSGELEGRVAIITGADSGIGRAIALAYAREGAKLLLTDLPAGDDASATCTMLDQEDADFHWIEGDLREEDFCQRLIDEAMEKFGGLSILVNNAGYQETRKKIQEWDTETFDRIFKTNIYAPFWLSRSAMKHLPAGGCIINTVSIQSFDPSGQLLAYASTKSALAGFTRALSQVAIKDGVRVNGVAPGPVWTPLIPGSFNKKKTQNFGSDTSFGRPAQPAELAPLYVWLASPKASYVTGEIYGATGGKMPL